VPELRLWHGINVPLILSGAILTLGYLSYRAAARRPLPGLPALLDGSRGFEAVLAKAQSIGAACNRALAGAPPSRYIAMLLAFAFAGALPLVGGFAELFEFEWNLGGTVLLLLLGVSLMLMVGLASKIGRILALTAVGSAVALLFGLLHAPDLLLTQLLVEVLTTVFFLLAVRFIGHREPPPQATRRVQALRLAFAATVGLAAAALVPALHALPTRTRIADYYFEAGPSIANGRNLVNLVLSDFRGLDTLIETFVVLVVGLGVVALLRGRELPPRPSTPGPRR
jgi:multicomponent Na+:H+ antiporter subunit A